jgi:hypothetical protein
MSEATCSAGWIACLYRWQEFAGALASALIAGTFILFQVWRGGADAREERAARYTAARASLSFGLTELDRYASHCCILLAELHRRASGEAVPRGTTVAPFPPIPEAAIASIVDLIGVSPRPVVQVAAKLLSGLQIQHSRLEASLADLEPTAPRSKLVVKTNLEEFMIDTAKLRARASSLFPLARFDTDKPPLPVNWDDVASALRQMELHDEDIPRVFETIAKRKASDRGL